VHARPEERRRWRLVGRGSGIHWDGLDEDISVAGLLIGLCQSPHRGAWTGVGATEESPAAGKEGAGRTTTGAVPGAVETLTSRESKVLHLIAEVKPTETSGKN